MIAEATGVDDPATCEIEDMMRDEAGGTLDHLGPNEFAELPATCALIARACNEPPKGEKMNELL